MQRACVDEDSIRSYVILKRGFVYRRLYLGFYGLGLLALLAAFFLWIEKPWPIHGTSFTVNGINLASSDLPWQFPVPEKQKFTAAIHVSATEGEPMRLRVLPTGCLDEILIDGESAYLADFPNTCDYPDGIALKVPSTGKDHEILLTGSNKGEHGGLAIQLENHQGAARHALPLFVLSILLLVEAFLLQRRWQWYLHPITLCAIALRFLYWSYTPWTTRAHDELGHTDYIFLLLRNGLPPAPSDCWQCYQPPLYYYPASWLTVFFAHIKAALPTNWEIQLLSFAANLIFLLGGLALLRRIKGSRTEDREPKSRGLIIFSLTFVFAFWPGLIVHCPRIGNDAFMYLFSALAFRSLWIWSEEGKHRQDALLASAFAGFALASKTSGIATLAAISITILLSIRSRRDLVTSAYCAVLWVTTFLLSLASPIMRYIQGASQFMIVGNADKLGENVKVSADPGNFLWFDLHSWLSNPFTSAVDDNFGRVWFLNYAGKTSLFGEFHLATGLLGEWLAALISLSALALIALALRGVLHLEKKDLQWLLALLLYVFALAAMRFLYPFSCSNDARYVLPAVIPFLYFVGRGLEDPFANSWVQRLVWIAVWTFPLASIALFFSMIPKG